MVDSSFNEVVSYSHQDERPSTPVPSVMSMASDESMKFPINFAEDGQITSVSMDESKGVLCSGCPQKAFKSCITCMASFCKDHVKMHYSAPALQKHQLVEPMEDLGQMLCQEHNRQHSFPREQLAVEEHLIKKGPPDSYRLPTEKINISGDEDVRRLTFGKRDLSKPLHTILVVGETGTGKTTLINTMVNYMLGVQSRDEVWFQITEEENPKCQGESQTTKITVYDVFVETSSLSLRIIDTPGYGSTDGTDQIVAEKLLVLFRSEDGVHGINAISLVVKSDQNHLTVFQHYIFDAILSLFGKDIEKNIVVFITHSDGMSVCNAIAAINAFKISIEGGKLKPHHFMFNNVQSGGYGEGNDVPYQRAWDLGYRSMERLLEFLHDSRVQQLKMSEDVLDERKKLEARIHNLQDAIKMKDLKQAELKQTLTVLEENKQRLGLKRYTGRSGNFRITIYGESLKSNSFASRTSPDGGLAAEVTVSVGYTFAMIAPAGIVASFRVSFLTFTYEINEPFKEKIPIQSSWWSLNKEATCCTICEENCHYPGCWWVKDLSWCSVMKDGRCTVCTGKCPVSNHVKEKSFYKPSTREVEENTVDLKALEKDIEESEVKQKELLEEAYRCILKLEEIALNRDSVSTLVHVQFLVEKMKEMGDEDKAKKLEDIQKRNKNLFRSPLLGILSAQRKRQHYPTAQQPSVSQT
ncbi:uncharacterized protein LOC134442714 [Engraulis encrasicolus]|uniref:uncharacterized protein LOC134442714 n=1 Tax=Engraulis encrasicolus TaxID=184585 RepID=UPI002FD5D875